MQEAQKHLSDADPVLVGLITRYGSCTLAPHTDYYRELVDSIISQQLSVKAGRTIFDRFLGLFGGRMPTPAEILQTDTEACAASDAVMQRSLISKILPSTSRTLGWTSTT